jgi:hypothetical protein
MNISRLSSVPANAQPASVRPFQSTTMATGAERRAEATEDRRHEHQPRVAEFASQIDSRLQGVIEEGNLSDDQIQELKAAAAQFQSLMSRIGSADFSAAPMRQVLFAIGQLGNQVQKVLHADDQGPNTLVRPPASGASSFAPTTLPSIDAVG